MFPTQSLTITPQNGSTLHSARARVYGPRAPYSTHLDLTPSPIPAGQASTSSIGRSHSNSPLNVSDIDGSSPSYLRRLSRPTRDILKVADIPGTTSQHSKFRSQRSYNNPVDPVYYWGDGLGGVMEMQTKKKLPRYLLSMFRGHNSHKTDDIEGAKPVNKMMSYAEKARMKHGKDGTSLPVYSRSPYREKQVPGFPITPLAGFLMDVHRTLGRPPVHKLKRRYELSPVKPTAHA